MVEPQWNDEFLSPSELIDSRQKNEPVHKNLKQLVKKACRHPYGSPQRQRYLTTIIRLIGTNKLLWKDPSPGYEDALQQTWVYFCSNLCEAITAKEPYDPDRALIATWLNAYLKRRLQDLQSNLKQEKQARFFSEETFDPIANLAAPPDVPPILAQVQHWVETDSDGELRRIHVKGRPDLTCQLLILRRLPPESGWKELSEEFAIPISTLSTFYERQCRPRLRKFGEQSGYL